MPRNALIQIRRDTAANWTSTNPTLAAGEQGFETDTGKFKIGTGSTAWTSLLYATDASDVTGTFSSITATGDISAATGGFTALKVQPIDTRVGIGTASPQYTLDVRGEMRSLFYGEKWTITGTAANGTLSITTTTSCNVYTNLDSTANWQIVLGASGYNISDRMAIGDTFTVTHASNQGATGYRMSGFILIDGLYVINNNDIKWQGGTAPTTGNTNTTDVYVFTILKTGSSSFEIFGSLTKFGA